LWIKTNAVWYATPNCRDIARALIPFTLEAKISIAFRIVFRGSLWSANLVPAVTENV
jgi:hypothetical protein